MPCEETLGPSSRWNAVRGMKIGPYGEYFLPFNSDILGHLDSNTIDNVGDIVHAMGPHGAEDGPLELPMQDGVLWEKGTTICVRFLDGDRETRARVRQYAKMWEKYANIEFKFVSRMRASHIRIDFDLEKGHNSFIGTNNLKVPRRKATMNLAISHRTPDYEVRRVVLHEFGHVLGCVHEHSSPAAQIPWNRQAVYDHYLTMYNWKPDKVKLNVLDAATNVTQFSHFDCNSIMLYSIPAYLTNGRLAVEWNTELSDTDKSFIAMMYPPDDVKCNRCHNDIDTSNPGERHRCK